MAWFKQSTMKNKPGSFGTKNFFDKIDLEITNEALYRGMGSLASEYYNQLSEEHKIKLPMIFKEITGKDYVGKTVLAAVLSLTVPQLTTLQKAIEADYKFTKH